MTREEVLQQRAEELIDRARSIVNEYAAAASAAEEKADEGSYARDKVGTALSALRRAHDALMDAEGYGPGEAARVIRNAAAVVEDVEVSLEGFLAEEEPSVEDYLEEIDSTEAERAVELADRAVQAWLALAPNSDAAMNADKEVAALDERLASLM